MNEYLDEVLDGPHLLPEDAKERARARIWMLSADSDFYPAVFVASVGRERGLSEERVSEAREKLKATLAQLEGRLGGGREYLAGTGSRWPTWRMPATSSGYASSKRRAPSRCLNTRTWPPG